MIWDQYEVKTKIWYSYGLTVFKEPCFFRYYLDYPRFNEQKLWKHVIIIYGNSDSPEHPYSGDTAILYKMGGIKF